MNKQHENLINRIRSKNLTYLPEERLRNIQTTISDAEKSKIPGVFIEAGCALGGSSILITSLKNRERRFLVYDVFGMIPPPSGHDSTDVHHRFKIISEGKSEGIGGEKYYGYMENLLEVVKSNFTSFGIGPEEQSVSFIKGLIQETMQIDEPVAFAHIDVDWYEAVMFCLETIFPKLSVGGSIIIDDYYDWDGCRKATDEFLSGVKGEYSLNISSGSFKISRIKSEKANLDEKSDDLLKYNEINIEDFLKKYSGKKVVYCSNPGNAGDAIIAHATFQLFEKLDIKPEIIKHEEIVNDKIIFYSGGGNLVGGKYNHAFNFITSNLKQNREIIILPHTIHGFDELWLSAKNITIFCREKISYQNLSSIGFPNEKLFLAHDMAFLLLQTEFQEYLKKGEGVANCFRTDQESARAFEIPKDNLDISLSWNGELWHRPDFAKNVTHNLACYLSAFETVKTDRLHVAILAAIMGKKVVLYPNNYYKIKAVYEYSIKAAFHNVTFIEIPVQNETLALEIKINELRDKLKKLEETLQEKERQIAGLSLMAEQLQQVFKSRSWRLTQPLRDIKKLFFTK